MSRWSPRPTRDGDTRLPGQPPPQTGDTGPPAPPRAGSVAALGRGWLIAIFAGCACYAGTVALVSGLAVHQRWGVVAAVGYALAAVAVAVGKRRGTDLALLVSLCGALLAPLGWMVATGRAQHEVAVISRSAWLLIQHGSPYHSAALLAGSHNPDAYDPYLPAMSLFGVARAVAGRWPLTDPRLGFAVVFAGVFLLALRAAGAVDVPRWTIAVLASPVVAFPLVAGGDDLPVLGLMCLGLALLSPPPGGGRRSLRAGLVLGAAAALKSTAWPALVIAAVLVAARDGRRALAYFLAAAVAALAILVGPVAATSPGALVDNTILFPLGLASVRSGAASPLPGFLLARTGHAGVLIVAGLLVAAGLGVAVSLVIRPPRDAAAAAWRLIVALVLLFLLAPSTRFGYFIYPLVLWLWLRISRAGVPAAGTRRAGSRIRLRT